MASAHDIAVITNIVSFNGDNGKRPAGPLILARDGNIYGTTTYGGSNSATAGTIFRVTPSGVFTNVVFFNVTNGAYPSSGVIQGMDGNFYGTTAYGGAFADFNATNYGFGTVFQLTSNGLLHSLSSFSNKIGYNPNGLLETSPGIFYGTAVTGGTNSDFSGYGLGTIFMADTNGFLTNIISFNGTNGANPSIGLISAGNLLFGSTTAGGPNAYGLVYQFTTNGTVPSTFIFDLNNGAVPNNLITGADGNLYGTTLFGGSNQLGTIFRLTTNFTFTTVFTFNGTNGSAPTTLLQSTNGSFYGTTSQGGAYDNGNIFKLATNGTLTSLYDFTGGNDGSSPASLLQIQDGSFYGTTMFGGTSSNGNVFKLTFISPPVPNIQNLLQTNASISFTFSAASNQTYDIQYKTNLAQTNWMHLQTVTPTNNVGSVVDSTASDAQRFYRVALP